MTYHFTSIRMVIIQIPRNKQTKKCWWGCRKTELLAHCWWKCEMVQSLWKTVQRLLKKWKNRATVWSNNSTLGFLSKRTEIRISHTYFQSHVLCIIIHNSQDVEKTNHQQINGWRKSGVHILLLLSC